MTVYSPLTFLWILTHPLSPSLKAKGRGTNYIKGFFTPSLKFKGRRWRMG